MKSIIFAMAATLMSASSQAQQLQASNKDQKEAILAKDFQSSESVDNTTWYETPDRFVIKYHLNDIAYRIDYSKKGQWLNTIRTYDEAKLPVDIKNLVKTSYHDYKIILVEEIEKPADNLTYIIHLEGKKNFINVRFWNGEIDEWQKFDKPKMGESVIKKI